MKEEEDIMSVVSITDFSQKHKTGCGSGITQWAPVTAEIGDNNHKAQAVWPYTKLDCPTPEMAQTRLCIVEFFNTKFLSGSPPDNSICYGIYIRFPQSKHVSQLLSTRQLINFEYEVNRR